MCGLPILQCLQTEKHREMMGRTIKLHQRVKRVIFRVILGTMGVVATERPGVEMRA